MLTMTRPLPTVPYTGPIHVPRRPLPVTPPPPMPSSSTRTTSPTGTQSPVLKRRPHTRRLQSAPSPDLPSVREEEEIEEIEVTEEQTLISKSKKRPRPAPLVPSRTYATPSLPLIEIPENAGTFDRPLQTDEYESFALSPSTLLTRRRSETILDFPLPPSRSLPIPTSSSSPLAPTDNSPTPSYLSFTSTSSASSSPSPRTPHPSEVDENGVQPQPEKLDSAEMTTENWLDERSPRQPYRSASVVSLRSFNTEFDAQVEGIYALLQPQRPAVVQSPDVPRHPKTLAAPVPNAGPSPRLVLSVLDTTRGGSFEVPLILGSFLSMPSSPSSSHSPLADVDDEESDGEGIPITWSDSEVDDLGPALSSSEDDASDNEGPRRWLDPEFHKNPHRRRLSRDGSRSPVLPPLPMLDPLDMGPDTPSVYSMASPVDWNHERLPPRESLVPSDVPRESFAPPARLPPLPDILPPRPPSPFYPARGDSPVLRSRFSTSTFGSLPPQPTSSTQAFFARITGRAKPPSPSKSERSPTLRASLRRRQVPASPAPSAFSFSTHSSRSSLDSASADSSSVISDDSASSSGLRRPPIPIELFLRG